ncbi:MAG: Transcriptional regulator [Caulobacteraceae bacterium]|jgi:AcrR family transcriptional regulator|nr:Transcriptional regulator [Caulobacteraceae bacterium]
MRSLKNEARTARHAAVLDEASLEFNRAGVAGASLVELARRIGITRAGLYNYCADRQDLVTQCYLRACADMQADLQRAAQLPGASLDKVVAFINLALDPHHRPVAVLTELGFLSAEQQARVRAARQENIRILRDMIAGGVRDGSVRACDHNLAAHCVFGMLTWSTLSRVWTNNPDETLPGRLAKVVPVIVADGMASDGTKVPTCRLRIADVIPTSPGRDETLEALARAGSNLFNHRGIDGVSLDEVAAEIGLTKGAIYHHFDSKPAFVAYCYDRAFKVYEAIQDAAGTGKTGIECLMILIHLTTEAQLEEIHTLWPTTGFGSLSETLQRRLSERSNFLIGRGAELARRGIVDGTVRPLDILPMNLASAGAHSLLAQWLPADESRSPPEIAHEIGRFLFLGLRNRGP